MKKLLARKKKTKSSVSLFFSKKKSRRGVGNGTLFVFGIVGLTMILGGAAIGRVTPKLAHLEPPQKTTPAYTCCDTGDGEACKPIPEKKIFYKGIKSDTVEEYHLLKSNVYLRSQDHHINPDLNGATTDQGERIFYNPRSELNQMDWAPECFSNVTSPGKQKYGYDDFIFGPGNGPQTNPDNKDYPQLGCYAIPNEEIIYVCRKENAPGECDKREGHAIFDAYFRAKDYPNPGIHNVIKNCVKPEVDPKGGSKQRIVALPTNGAHKNLQLETFFIEEDPPFIEWLSPYCKPAIYLYPEKETQVNVKVEPKGPFTLTIPPYTKDGWTVTAYPDGRIMQNDQLFPYLYWEASMPDNVIKVPKEGYVVPPAEMENLLTTILPQLGLNYKESKEFKEYWIKVLPKSPYYFVGVMPESDIDAMAPLTVSPKPDTVKRVTLYFKPLEKKETVQAPKITPFTRKGFTVIEWGGLFKGNEKHKGFTCMM